MTSVAVQVSGLDFSQEANLLALTQYLTQRTGAEKPLSVSVAVSGEAIVYINGTGNASVIDLSRSLPEEQHWVLNQPVTISVITTSQQPRSLTHEAPPHSAALARPSRHGRGRGGHAAAGLNDIVKSQPIGRGRPSVGAQVGGGRPGCDTYGDVGRGSNPPMRSSFSDENSTTAAPVGRQPSSWGGDFSPVHDHDFQTTPVFSDDAPSSLLPLHKDFDYSMGAVETQKNRSESLPVWRSIFSDQNCPQNVPVTTSVAIPVASPASEDSLLATPQSEKEFDRSHRSNCLLLFELSPDAEKEKVIEMIQKALPKSGKRPPKIEFWGWEEAVNGRRYVRVELPDRKDVVSLWKFRHKSQSLVYDGKPVLFDIDCDEEYEDDKFLIRNIASGTNEEEMLLHLRGTRVFVESLGVKLRFVGGSDETEAVVYLGDSLADEQMLDDLKQRGADLETANGEDVQLSFSLIPASLFIKIRGLAQNVHKGMLRNYLFGLFDLESTPLVERIEIQEPGHIFLVKMRTLSDLDAVMKYEALPLLAERQPQITRHWQYPPSPGEDVISDDEDVSEPLEIIVSDPSVKKEVVDYVLQGRSKQATRALNSVGEISWNDDTDNVTIRCTKQKQSASAEEVEGNFFRVYDLFSRRELKIPTEDLWEKVVGFAEKENNARGDDVMILKDPSKRLLVFVGEKGVTDGVHSQCAQTLSGWVQQKEKREEIVTKTISFRSVAHFDLLSCCEEFKNLKSNEVLRIDSNMESRQICVNGPEYLVNIAISRCW
eukprot:m.275505 g.275505  ORF g.275505 m.275505 type:complete len:769 (+) comp40601_c0_seq4:78-2384(+)